MIDISVGVHKLGRHSGCYYRHSGCRNHRHDGCRYRRNGCYKYRHNGYSGPNVSHPNVIADAATPLLRMQHCRHNGCMGKCGKGKYAFSHKALRIRPTNANPSLIFSNYRSTSTCVGEGTDQTRNTIKQISSQCKGPQDFDVNRCKNIAKFTFECKRIQNFRFDYIAMLRANTRSSRNQRPNHAPLRGSFSAAAYAQSRGVKGPPLPTQFGFAKLYRG